MNVALPATLKAEHEQLHQTLVRATQESGEIGVAAREVARLLHPHFVKEETFALPPLGLRYYGKQSRSFSVQHEVDEANAGASYKDGILELTLPKKTGSAAKQLPVK